MGVEAVVVGGPPHRCLALAGLALLLALFGWLMLVDGWTTGWSGSGGEAKEGVAWSQSVTRLPRDLLLMALLVVVYLHSRAGHKRWHRWTAWLPSGQAQTDPSKGDLVDCPTPLDASTTVPPPAPDPLDPLALLLHWLRDTWALLVRRLMVWSDPASGWIPWLGSVFQRVTKAGGWNSGAASALQSKSSIQEVAAKPERVRGVFEALTERELRTISHLSTGADCISALQTVNANHTRRLKEAIPDVFLLHLGALLGEKSALRALTLLNRQAELGGSHALFGKLHECGSWEDGWSKPVTKSRPGVTFETSRRKWRRGLFLYRTTTIIEDALPSEFRAFNMDMSNRKEWDWSMEEWHRLTDPLDGDPCANSCFYFHEARMPGPMANRLYICARRVWGQPDGGCYWIAKSAQHPSCSETMKGRVRIEEYTSASILRAAKSRQGNNTPAVELSSFYYDDPKMKPIAYNLAMKSAFWAAMQATEKAFRHWRQGMVEQEGPRELDDRRTRGWSGPDGRIDGRKRRGRGRLGGVVKGLVVSGLVLIAHKKIGH